MRCVESQQIFQRISVLLCETKEHVTFEDIFWFLLLYLGKSPSVSAECDWKSILTIPIYLHIRNRIDQVWPKLGCAQVKRAKFKSEAGTWRHPVRPRAAGWSGRRRPVGGGGQRLRPESIELCCQDLGGPEAGAKAGEDGLHVLQQMDVTTRLL